MSNVDESFKDDDKVYARFIEENCPQINCPFYFYFSETSAKSVVLSLWDFSGDRLFRYDAHNITENDLTSPINEMNTEQYEQLLKLKRQRTFTLTVDKERADDFFNLQHLINMHSENTFTRKLENSILPYLRGMRDQHLSYFIWLDHVYSLDPANDQALNEAKELLYEFPVVNNWRYAHGELHDHTIDRFTEKMEFYLNATYPMYFRIAPNGSSKIDVFVYAMKLEGQNFPESHSNKDFISLRVQLDHLNQLKAMEPYLTKIQDQVRENFSKV